MLKFENPTNGRFYYIEVTKDMLNERVIRIVFGGRNVCRLRTVFCGDSVALHAELDRLIKRRMARGYILIH